MDVYFSLKEEPAAHEALSLHEEPWRCMVSKKQAVIGASRFLTWGIGTGTKARAGSEQHLAGRIQMRILSFFYYLE